MSEKIWNAGNCLKNTNIREKHRKNLTKNTEDWKKL